MMTKILNICKKKCIYYEICIHKKDFDLFVAGGSWEEWCQPFHIPPESRQAGWGTCLHLFWTDNVYQ